MEGSRLVVGRDLALDGHSRRRSAMRDRDGWGDGFHLADGHFAIETGTRLGQIGTGDDGECEIEIVQATAFVKMKRCSVSLCLCG